MRLVRALARNHSDDGEAVDEAIREAVKSKVWVRQKLREVLCLIAAAAGTISSHRSGRAPPRKKPVLVCDGSRTHVDRIFSARDDHALGPGSAGMTESDQVTDAHDRQ
jgi:hypothetical protein